MFLKGSIKALTLHSREDPRKTYYKVTLNTPSEIVSSVHHIYVKIYLYIIIYLHYMKYLSFPL